MSGYYNAPLRSPVLIGRRKNDIATFIYPQHPGAFTINIRTSGLNIKAYTAPSNVPAMQAVIGLVVRFLSTLVLSGVICSAAINVADVDTIINAGLGCHDTPGLAVAVVKDGQVLLSKGYGVKNQTSGDAVTNTTLFTIASLTKAFTTTLLNKVLYDNGR